MVDVTGRLYPIGYVVLILLLIVFEQLPNLISQYI